MKYLNSIFSSNYLTSFTLLLLVYLSYLFFSNPSTQGINWTFPYFSGAANFSELFKWQISPSDYEILKRELNSNDLVDYLDYKHQRTDDLIDNTVNNYGYVLVALASQKIFPFLGDIQGVIWLQLSMHILFSIFFVINIIHKPLHRLYFLIFYAANPLIIYFTTFPFYYFWMFIPSYVFSVLILRPEGRLTWVCLSTPLLLLSILIRPTTVFLAVLIYILSFLLVSKNKERLLVFLVFLFFILALFYISSMSSGSPWHTMYVGIGAYPNDNGVNVLSDSEAYSFFYDKTGLIVDTNAVNGNFNDPVFRDLYLTVMKERYLQILFDNPLILIRNAFLNLFQVFSIGYIVDSLFLSYIDTVLGFIVFIFLIYTKQFLWIIAILASSISFVLYYPPIPAYNFASYLLLVMATLYGFDRFFKDHF